MAPFALKLFSHTPPWVWAILALLEQFWQVHRGLVVRASAISTALRDESGKVLLTLRGRR